MSELPAFSPKGRTDSEKISEIISYLMILSSALDREMLSIDSPNLNKKLSDKIDGSIQEHQDLSGYASKNYVKSNCYTKNEVYTTSQTYSNTEIDRKIEDVEDKFDDYTTTANLQKDYLTKSDAQKNYLGTDALNGYATQDWVIGYNEDRKNIGKYNSELENTLDQVARNYVAIQILAENAGIDVWG